MIRHETYDPSAAEVLYASVYDQLKTLARRELRARGRDATLDTTELVHEAYLKLRRTDAETWESRAHFFGAASRAMRQVLVDVARRRTTLKRGRGWLAVSLDRSEGALQLEAEEVLALDRALDELDSVDQRLRQVVELRFFGGVPEREIALMLGVSSRTVERDWLKARLFLLGAIDPET